jgi:hypothetical protein
MVAATCSAAASGFANGTAISGISSAATVLIELIMAMA